MNQMKDIYRLGLYVAATVAPAIAAGYAAIGQGSPNWLLFGAGVISALAGSAAVSHFTPIEGSVNG